MTFASARNSILLVSVCCTCNVFTATAMGFESGGVYTARCTEPNSPLPSTASNVNSLNGMNSGISE